MPLDIRLRGFEKKGRLFRPLAALALWCFLVGVLSLPVEGENMNGNRELTIDCNFPGGNIEVLGVEGDTVRLRPDLRDTEGWWFYWYFRVRGASGRTIRFQFEGDNPIGTRGPAFSLNGGLTWNWLGADSTEDGSFTYAFPQEPAEVRFSFGMPYTELNLKGFLASCGAHANLVCETLCETKQGRQVELLRVGNVEGTPDFRILLTCRHHACEMMASYTLESIIETALSEDPLGEWLRDHVEFLIVPFVDKDGVENGDQGKNREPYDHNRDYAGESLYASVAALREYVPTWSQGRLRMSLDLHCPWIRGEYNEHVYFPGTNDAKHWNGLGRFSATLESNRTQDSLPFKADGNLPYGQRWNKRTNYNQGKSCTRWASEFPENWLAAGMEIPYANAGGMEVNARSARNLGHNLAQAMRLFLEQEHRARRANNVKPESKIPISGVFPHLAAVAEHSPRSESGIGALMPWADRLWFVTYLAHKKGTGGGTGLFELDVNMNLHKRPESVVGTYANRMIHSKSNQLIIGPHFIDTEGTVRTCEALVDQRLAATMEHLKDPETKVYFLTMEGLFFEADVITLEVAQLFDLNEELGIPEGMKAHFKSGFTGCGRVVVANNTYDERDFLGEGGGGRLAEWDGEKWTILERTAFTEVSGNKNLSRAVFATGWDRASAILKVCKEGEWSIYRLPKASHTFDHAWCTEWMRIREVETERLLMDCHGMFYELPYHLYDGKVWGIRPICTHLRMVPDFCSWRGLLVLGGNEVTPIGDSNLFAGQPQSNLWFGKTDDLWQFGKPKGWGGPWWEEPVKAGVPSVPYLMTGFDKKVLHLSHDADRPVEFRIEVDFLGNQTWKTYTTVSVEAHGYQYHVFPDGFSAHWVRVTADSDCRATACFVYD